jgi:hypothetical protein
MFKQLPLVLVLLFAIILLPGCKKDGTSKNDTTTDAEFVGTWALNSFDNGDGPYLVSDAPCLSNNLFVVKSNKTTEASYIGLSNCIVGSNSSNVVGYPGAPVTVSTWSKSGNTYIVSLKNTVGNIVNSYGTITNVNSKLNLKLVDTARGSFTPPYRIYTWIYTKK